MMKKIIGLAICAVLMGGAANATPITFTDTTLFAANGTIAPEDYISHGWGDVNFLQTPTYFGALDYVTWKHQFTFLPPASKILGGTLMLSLRDDNDCSWEFALGYTENGQWAVGEVDTQKYSFKIDPTTLADGVFMITVKSLCGDFFIDKSRLTICYEPVSAPVPEPGTIVLLGSGLLGLGFYGRRRMKK